MAQCTFWLGLYLSVCVTLSLQHSKANRASHFDQRFKSNHAASWTSTPHPLDNKLSRGVLRHSGHRFPNRDLKPRKGNSHLLDLHEKSTHELLATIRRHYHFVRTRNALNTQLGRLSTQKEWSRSLNVTETVLRQNILTAEVSQSILIERHYALVLSMARKYVSSSMAISRTSYQDVVQEGTIGLIYAAERFDPCKGTAFNHYATYWIRQRISSFMRKHARMIRLPSHVISALGAVEKTKRSFLDHHGREPTTEEISDACGVTQQNLRLYAEGSASVGSLENVLDGDLHSGRTEERIGTYLTGGSMETPEESTMQSLLRDNVAGLMDGTLNSREIQVLELRFGLVGGSPKSIAEVGERCKVTRDKVRRIEARALNKLRSSRLQHQF